MRRARKFDTADRRDLGSRFRTATLDWRHPPDARDGRTLPIGAGLPGRGAQASSRTSGRRYHFDRGLADLGRCIWSDSFYGNHTGPSNRVSPVGLPLLEALLSVELLPADISVSLLPVLPVKLLLLLVAFSALHLRLLVMGGEGAGLGRMRMWAGRVVFTLMFSVLLFILVLPPLPALAIVGR